MRLQVRLPASVELDDLLQAGALGYLMPSNAMTPYKERHLQLRSAAYPWRYAG